jgi:hypothetical protein
VLDTLEHALSLRNARPRAAQGCSRCGPLCEFCLHLHPQHADESHRLAPADGHALCEFPVHARTETLIRSNMAEPQSRHLMLITENYAALQMLQASNVLATGAAKVIVGSTFRDDRTQLAVGLAMQEVISCMATGRTVVLVQTEQLYESLYDMLNQHYRSSSSQRYARMALGSDSRYCPVRYPCLVIVSRRNV